MTPEQIRTELETAEGLPAEALAEAVIQAEALSPDVVALLHKAASGVHLLPRQENLLFFGLHALATARRSEACPAFLDLLRRPERQLEDLFGDGLAAGATGLLLGLYDDDPEPLFAALEDRTTTELVRCALFQVLARLSWEGRVPGERLVALIDRFDREEMAPDGDLSWMGWADAIRLLGLERFEPRLRHAWETERTIPLGKADCDWWLESLHEAASHPDDSQRFVESGVIAITDPVACLAWLAGSEQEPEKTSDEPDDPAEAIRLNELERDWLDGFLASAQVSATTMDLEQLDGFFTALIAGPEMVPPSEYMKAIWGEEESDGPTYDSLEQAQFVMDLLMRHWNTIAARLDARFPHTPLIFPQRPEAEARSWAVGFTMGVDLRRDAWEPLLRGEAGPFVVAILSLIADDYYPDAEEMTPKERLEVIEMLPSLVLAIALYRRDPLASLLHKPARSTKIGRNEPCPCGSGRKYKKCCGVAA